MPSLWYFILGYVIIEMEAVRVEQALSRVSQAGIELADVRRVSHTIVRAKLKCGDFKKFCAAISGVARAEVKKAGGTRALIDYVKRHVVLFAGILFAALAVFVISLFCFDIKVVGVETMDPGEILRVIEEKGIAPVMLKSSIDLDAVEWAVWQAFPDFTYVYASFDGVSMVVEVREGVPAPEIYDTQPSSIYASNSGVITELIVYSGQAVVKVGDRVQKGDLLITGNYESNGLSFSVAARGKVTARTDYFTTVVSKADCNELIPTGNVATERVMFFLGKRIHITGGNPFPIYMEESCEKSSFGENSPAYMRVVEITYREAEKVFSEEKKQKAIDAATQAAYNNTVAKLAKDAEICCFYTYMDDSQGDIRVTLTLSAYEQIGVRGGALSSYLPDPGE